MKKVFSYILIGVGALAMLGSYPSLRNSVGITIPAGIADNYIMIAGAIIALIGAFVSYKTSSKKTVEVPIYEGQGKHRKVVGYQRHEQ